MNKDKLTITAGISEEDLDALIYKIWCEFNSLGDNPFELPAIPMSKELREEIRFRCSDFLKDDNIVLRIKACLDYVKENGIRAFIKEIDNCKIWRYEKI